MTGTTATGRLNGTLTVLLNDVMRLEFAIDVLGRGGHQSANPSRSPSHPCVFLFYFTEQTDHLVSFSPSLSFAEISYYTVSSCGFGFVIPTSAIVVSPYYSWKKKEKWRRILFLQQAQRRITSYAITRVVMFDYDCGRLPAAALSMRTIAHKRTAYTQRLSLAKQLPGYAGACNLSPSLHCVAVIGVTPRR